MGKRTGRRPLKELSKAAETAVLRRQVLGRLKLNRWLGILRELARYDEAGELLRARTRKRAVRLGLIFFLTLFALPFAAAYEFETIAWALVCVALIEAALLAYLLLRNRRLKGLDLADDFRTVLIPFLSAIRDDVPSGDKVRLKLDLAGPSKAKVIRELDLPHRGGKKIHETVYSDPWCRLEAPLASGSHITLDITNTFTLHDVRWKTSRGKYKRKSKWKKVVEVRAGISPDAGRFALDPSAVEEKSGPGGVRLKKRLGGDAAVMKTKQKFKSQGPAAPAQSVQPNEILVMFLKLGSVIRPLETGSQQP